MKLRSVFLVAAVISAPALSATAATAIYTTLGDFQAAVPNATLIEDFETRGPTNTQLLTVLGTNEVFRTLATGNQAGAHDLIVTANNHAAFDIPGGHTTSRVLTSFASEEFRDSFTTANHATSAPVHAVGFDVLLTSSFTTTIRFFSDALATHTIQTLTFSPDTDPNNNYRFVGFTSDVGIAGFDFVTNGADDTHNSGIDNIYALPAGEELPVTQTGIGVPEPASWVLMIGGFGLVGAGRRRRRAALTA